MKKLNIFCSLLAVAAFTACDDKSDLGIPQVNPQEPVLAADALTLNLEQGVAQPDLSLANYQGAAVIPVASTNTPENLPEGASIVLDMDLATEADFSNAITIPVVDGNVETDVWNTYFREKLGKSPAAKSNYIRFAAYVVSGSVKSRVGTPDTWFGEKELNVTPIPMDFTIEENYYLIGNINGWSLSTSNPFNHSSANVYDDPVFTQVVEITEDEAAAGWWWKIATPKAIEDQDWNALIGVATDGDTALEGSLVDENVQAGCIKEAGTFLFSINMMDMTYSLKALTYLYTPGNANGWSQVASQTLKFDAEKGVYMGFANINGGFKFTSQADWDGTNYGLDTMEEVKDDNGNLVSYKFTLSTDGGAGNLDLPEGLYFCKVDTENLTAEATPVTSWGMIGGFNSWGGDVDLTADAENNLIWTGTLTVEANTEFKFRANGGWSINLGGTMSDLWFDGANLPVNAGTYKITLDLTKMPYTFSAE